MSAKLQEAVRYIDPLCSHDYIPMAGLARTASGNHFQRTDDFDPELARSCKLYATLIQDKILDTITDASTEDCNQRKVLNRRLCGVIEKLREIIARDKE